MRRTSFAKSCVAVVDRVSTPKPGWRRAFEGEAVAEDLGAHVLAIWLQAMPHPLPARAWRISFSPRAASVADQAG